ncbi:ubiquinol-cytochrome c reductase complex assembly factor 5 [Dendropsophus ebraccatus]|uniref:ubiquinol-cytochrome c reductase complex assembly factor 5 n=1 Tax=Dendropsophus ebraccatus TaxID=150705 RepID=UPI0038310A19
MNRKSTIGTLMDMVPGKRRFGMYRFLPFFFVMGGAMEWFMINVRIGKETFYDVYRRRQSERLYEEKTLQAAKGQS